MLFFFSSLIYEFFDVSLKIIADDCVGISVHAGPVRLDDQPEIGASPHFYFIYSRAQWVTQSHRNGRRKLHSVGIFLS